MRIIRYLLLVLLAFAPGFALAQQDSVVVRVGDLEFPAYPALFGQPFEEGVEIGPAPLAAIEPAIGCAEDPDNPGGFVPVVENPEELEGNIALISRGTCAFVVKAQAATQAGALGYIVYNDDRMPPGDMSLVLMGGECEFDVCSVPGVFVSRASGLALLTEEEFGSEAVLDPIVITPPPPTPTVGTHDTGVVALDVFDYGFLGTDADFGGTGFTFDGVNGLFVGSVLVGIDGNVVSNPYNGFPEWTAVSEVEPIASPLPQPFQGYDTGFVTAFESADLGVLVTERSFSRDGDPFVVLELDVENVSGEDIQEAYIGLFADFDAGTMWEDDAAAVEEDFNLVYVYDPVEDAPYFGVMAIPNVRFLSGYSADATAATDAQLFEALATEVEIAPDLTNRAAVVGLGPFEIAAGMSIRAVFAFIAGSDEVDLLATAAGCFVSPCPLATEASTPEGTFRLESVYPNPLASQATIGFTLPTAQDVRLAVYDVLGREVAVLADGARAAGEQVVAFDASALPSGVYLVRLEADAVQLVERVTVVR